MWYTLQSVKEKYLTGGLAVEDGRLLQTVLLDYYGALLTDKQRECCELYYNEDLSLSEIAEQCGVSRQGVWDNIRRAEAALRETEEKTGLVRRLTGQQAALEKLREQAAALAALTRGEAGELAEKLLRGIEALIG